MIAPAAPVLSALHRIRRPLAVLGLACLLGSGALASAAAAGPPGPPATVLDHQRTDAVSVRDAGDRLDVVVAAGRGSGVVDLLDPAQLAYQVSDEHAVLGSEPFLGEPGAAVWLLAADGGAGTLTASWDAEAVAVGAFADDVLTVRLVGADGPGAVELSTDRGDGPARVLSSRDAEHAAHPLVAGRRLPVAWAFTAPGEYVVTLQVTGHRADGTEVASAPLPYRFLVGSDAAPEPAPEPTSSAVPTAEPAPEPAPTPAAAPTPEAEPTPPLRSVATPASPSAPAVDDPTAPPTGALPAPDAAQLGDASRGDVSAPGTAVAPGTTITVTVPADYQGRWLSVWVLSTPTDLGWKQVNAAGTFTATLPEDLALGGHRLVVRERTAELVGWAPVDVAEPEQATEECIATPVTTTVRAGDVDVVTSGHFDFGPVVEGGALRALVKDDRTAPASWVDPATLVFHLTDAAAVQPPGGAFAFLGTGTVWQIPLTQSPNVPWLGWNTQHPTIAGHTSGGVTLTLDRLEGPGQLAVYSLDSWGGVGNRYFGTVDGFSRSTTIAVGASGVHVHGIWAFTQPGAYRATLSFAGDVDGRRQTATSTLTFFVGAGDPTSAVGERTATQIVGRTPSGEECELPVLAATGTDPRQAEDLVGLAAALFVVGLAFVGAAALGRRTAEPLAA